MGQVKNDLNTRHRFLDEAGDTAFFGNGRTPIIGIKENVSLCFILGMAKIKNDLVTVRQQIKDLENEISSDPYFFDVPSIQKRVHEPGGYYFHSSADPSEVRKIFFDYIKSLDFSFEAVVGRKIPSLFITKHNSRESEFYNDMLSHLLKNKFQVGGDLILNIASRANSTKNANLDIALEKAKTRFIKKYSAGIVSTRIVFNVQNPKTEPVLCIPDYLNWAIQRVFERGETRYYNFLKEKMSLVIDLYDSEHFENSKNYYTPKNPLSPLNKISPPTY